jgi:uncharacterized protein (DUF2336 family)
MVSSLSHADVTRLLAEPSPLVRAEVASKLAAEIDSPRLTEAEHSLAQDIVRVMAKDVEATVRAALSQSLRGAVRLPHDVALRLANDIEIVAMPILSFSPVLTDQDLMKLVRQGSPEKQQAIAGRSNLSEKVADVIIADAGENAVVALMNNITARISETGLGKAVDRFPQSEAVTTGMVKRQTLPVTVAERLVTLVSEQLKDYLVSHHDLPPMLAADLVLQSRERSIIRLNQNVDEQDIEKLVAQMHVSKRLTASLVLRALCKGDIAFFEAAISVLANIPLANARILIHDGGRLGLKSLYTKSGLPTRLFPAVRMAIEVLHEMPFAEAPDNRERYRTRVIERILSQYENFGADELDYLLEKLGDVLTSAA